MTTFTEMVAAVVVHSSVAAYSHFGVTLEPVLTEPPPAVERTVERTTTRKTPKTPDRSLTRLKEAKA